MAKTLWMLMCYTPHYDGNKVAGIYTTFKKAEKEKIKLICGYLGINENEYDPETHFMDDDSRYEIEKIEINETYIKY